MIKIVELGWEVPQTGESRVQLVDTRLMKTASNEIQEYWAKLDKSPDKAYLHVIAMTDSGKYGPNNNGDYFDGKDLRAWHHTFVDNAHVFLHHVNKDPLKSIGKPIYSWFNENMHRVELILELDKNSELAKETIERIKRGDQIYVSMGVSVSFDICSICKNQAKTRAQYCDHLKYNMKKILPNGQQVYAINPAPLKFFDISVVNKPADRTAWALDKAASAGFSPSMDWSDTEETSSAELGEKYAEEQACLAGIRKLSELIKKVDGDAVDYKDDDESINLLKRIPKNSLRHLDYPVLSCKDLDDTKLSPGGMLRAILASGAPPSLGEMAVISGRHFMGDGFRESMIPAALDVMPHMLRGLHHDPSLVSELVREIVANYRGELEDEDTRERVIRIVIPPVRRRMLMLKTACVHSTLLKTAHVAMSAIGPEPMPVPVEAGSGFLRALRNSSERSNSTAGPGLTDTFTVRGPNGSEYMTNRVSTIVAQNTQDLAAMGHKLGGFLAGLAALGVYHSEAPLAAKLLAIPSLAALSIAIMKSSPPEARVATTDGLLIPANSVFVKKTASMEAAESERDRVATGFSMSVSAGLGLDYMMNKHVHYASRR